MFPGKSDLGMKSTSGVAAFMSGTLVCWKSSAQNAWRALRSSASSVKMAVGIVTDCEASGLKNVLFLLNILQGII